MLAAQRAGLPTIPALVNVGHGVRLTGDPPEVTPENVTEFFTDPPEWYEFTERGFEYHYSIEKNRRDHYDPAGLEWLSTLDEDDKSFLSEEFQWLKL